MEGQKKRRIYPMLGWLLAGLCLLLFLTPALCAGRSELLDRLSVACPVLSLVLAAALAVLNLRFRREKRWGLWLVNVLLLAAAFLPMLLLGGLWTLENGSSSDRRTVKELGLTDVSPSLEARYDSHGGFHGDGISMEVYGLDKERAFPQMQTLPGWHEGPMDQNTMLLSYGMSTERGEEGPFLTDTDGRPLAPQKDWAYWYFEDRQGTGDIYSTDVLGRYSLNFTLALCDELGRLYVFEMDT